MQRVDFQINDQERVERKDAQGNVVKDTAGNAVLMPAARFKGHVLVLEDRIRIVRDGANENTTGVEVTVTGGYLNAADFDERPVEETPAPPAEAPAATPAAETGKKAKGKKATE